jgi:predicted  nucleic acid-binding Zn-ribbon protein
MELDKRIHDRLDRMENKIDGLTETIVAIARLEGREVGMQNRIDGLEMKVDDQHKRIDTLHKQIVDVEKKNISLSFLDRMFWVLATASITGGVAWMVNNVA